jgi:23S rRNA (adenine1618-N6)-methyltransferase
MHPRNPFSKDYDLISLAKIYTPLNEHIYKNNYGNLSIPFSKNAAVKDLNTALLKSQYGINWELPVQNLCPPVPGRLDYLLHIDDLLKKRNLRVLDIGTGANLIYPILAVCHFGWESIASEIQSNSLAHAKKIISANSILSSVVLREQKNKAHIFKDIVFDSDNIDVVVCNPPFFRNAQEAQKQNFRKVKNLKLSAKDPQNFAGESNELWYKGGEEAFIKKIINESQFYHKQIHWFTSLVSNQNHLRTLKKAIQKLKPKEIKITNMDQGNKKSRFIAWTFR